MKCMCAWKSSFNGEKKCLEIMAELYAELGFGGRNVDEQEHDHYENSASFERR